MFNKKFAVLLAILMLSSFCVGLVKADTTVIPTVSPSPSPTATPNPTPTPAPTVDPDNVTTTIENSTYNGELSSQIQSINPNGQPIMQPTFNYTIVSLVFANAVSCGVNASGGHWTATQDSAGQITVYPDELGVYEVHFQVLYDRVVNQTIMLYIYSGESNQPRTIPLQIYNSGFTLDLELTIDVLPSYPSASEIAEAQNAANQQMMNQMNSSYQESLAKSEDRSNTANIISVGAVAGVVICGVIILLVVRHQRHEDNRINNLNLNGFGRGRE